MSADNLASLVVREAGIREERLAEALRWQVMHGGQLDTALQEMGLLDERTLLTLLAKAFGLAAVGREVIDRVDKETVEFFPRRLAEKYGVVPIAHSAGRLVVAVTHSPDFSLLEEISEVLRAHVQPVVTTELRMNYALYRLYGAPLMSRMENLLGLLGEDPEEIPSLAFVSDEKTSFSSTRSVVPGARNTLTPQASVPQTGANLSPTAMAPASVSSGYAAAAPGIQPIAATPASPMVMPGLPVEPVQDLAARQRREAVRARLLARLEAEENAERDREEERRTQRVPWAVDDVIAELALADNRDAMLDVVLRFAYRKLRTAAIFIIQRQPRPDGSKSPVFVGWDIIDPALTREDIVRLTIPVDGEHVLGNLWLMRSHYLGPMREDDPLRVSFGQSPRAALLVPILVGEHLIGALYGDGGDQVIPPASLAELQMVVPRLGKALGNLIVRKRHAANPVSAVSQGGIVLDDSRPDRVSTSFHSGSNAQVSLSPEVQVPNGTHVQHDGQRDMPAAPRQETPVSAAGSIAAAHELSSSANGTEGVEETTRISAVAELAAENASAAATPSVNTLVDVDAQPFDSAPHLDVERHEGITSARSESDAEPAEVSPVVASSTLTKGADASSQFESEESQPASADISDADADSGMEARTDSSKENPATAGALDVVESSPSLVSDDESSSEPDSFGHAQDGSTAPGTAAVMVAQEDGGATSSTAPDVAASQSEDSAHGVVPGTDARNSASDTAPALFEARPASEEVEEEKPVESPERSSKSAFSLAPPSPRIPSASTQGEMVQSAEPNPVIDESTTDSGQRVTQEEGGLPQTAPITHSTDFDVDVELGPASATEHPHTEAESTARVESDELDVELAQEHVALQEHVPEIDQALERLEASSSGSLLAAKPGLAQDAVPAPTSETVASESRAGNEQHVEQVDASSARSAQESSPTQAQPQPPADLQADAQVDGTSTREGVATEPRLTTATSEASAPMTSAPAAEESIALDLEALSVFDPLRRFARESTLPPPVAQRTSDLPISVEPEPHTDSAQPSGAVEHPVADSPDENAENLSAESARVEQDEPPLVTAVAPGSMPLAKNEPAAALYNTIPESPGEDARESTLLQTWRVWLDASDGEADQRVRALDGGNGIDEELCAWVCGLRERSAAALARSFPGKLTMHPFGSAASRPSVSELSEVCACLVELGPTLAAPILVGELSHEDRMHRFAAVWSLSELYVPAAVPSLAQRLFDREMRIARIALEVLGRYRKAPAFSSVLERLRDLCRRGDHLQRSRSIEALTEFRDRHAVDALVGLLGTRPETIAEEARQALVLLTCQDFRQSERRWRAWYADHGQEPRTRWLIDALHHKSAELRKLAQDELYKITGQSFGYDAEAPRRAREAAAKTWLDWWRVQGADAWP